MGNVVDSSGKPILDSSGNPIKTGSSDAAKVSKNNSTSGADKVTPEQKKYFSSMDTNQSVFTEAEIEAVRAGGDESLAKTMEQQNEDAIAALGENAEGEATDGAVQGDGDKSPGEGRKSADSLDPNLRGPSRAQENYSLKANPTAFMSGLPRQKFQYVATFRFNSDDAFNTIFQNQIDAQVERNMAPDQYNGADAGFAVNDTTSDAYKEGEKISRNKVIGDLKKSLIWNIKSIDGPKVTMAMDVLNQYNRKRNVYRRVEYDPINVRFYDTMNSAAMNLWKYLYEHHVRDGRNKSWKYQGIGNVDNIAAPYQRTIVSGEDVFMKDNNYGVDIAHGYDQRDGVIKSLDLYLVHGRKFTLIRYVNPKITAMDHDNFTYESSGPIEMGMQFAYETVLYETINHPIDELQDSNIDLKELFQTAEMPETPATEDFSSVTNDGEGSIKDDSYMTKMTGETGVQDPLSANSAGSGTTATGSDARGDVGAINTKGGSSIFGSIMGGQPITDSISAISNKVYNGAKSVGSSFGTGSSSTGSMFSNWPNSGGKYNPDSPNYVKPKKGYVKDSKGRVIKDSSGNAIRGGTGSNPNTGGGASYR